MSSETSKVSGLSGRYAVALFDLAKEKGVLDTVSSDLETIQKILSESADFGAVLRNPMIARNAQVAAVVKVVEKAGASETILNFVLVCFMQ